MRVRLLALLLSIPACAADEPIGWRAEEAEQKGDIVRAWTLYTQAAALDAKNPRWAGKALALRTEALEKARVVYANETETIPLDPAIVRPFTSEELAELERLKAPPDLRVDKKRQRFDFRGPVRTVWEGALKTCGLEPVFDGDFNLTNTIHLRLDDADCGVALRALENISGSFLSPISERLVLIARESAEKRREQERTIAVSIPLPEPVAVQEAQELARGVQQLFEIQKFAIDSARRLAMIRDRVSKVRPAQMMFEQLLFHRPQIVVDVEFMEVNRSRDMSFGLNLQNLYQIVNFGTFMNNTPNILDQFTRFLTFGGGKTLFGIGITDSSLFATMMASNSSIQFTSQIRSLDGQAATLHVGDRYPIITQSFSGTDPQTDGASAFALAPTVQFEDLGLTIKITPRVHGSEDVTLSVESEFKVLTGQSFNDIPVISNRSYNGQVRLKNGEWAVCAGLLTTNNTAGYTGIAGLSQIPGAGWGLRSNQMIKSRGELLIVLKPRIINLAPTEFVTRTIWTGSETKPLPPL